VPVVALASSIANAASGMRTYTSTSAAWETLPDGVYFFAPGCFNSWDFRGETTARVPGEGRYNPGRAVAERLPLAGVDHYSWGADMLWKQLFARKSLEMLQAEAAGENRLRRVLGPVALTSLGVGAIIGAGIFVITGRVAAQDAGPAILLSFGVAGVACALAALCYAEFASMAPVAGSAYTYAYATLGELLAWIIGWDLILEYALSAATVASAWSEYLNAFLEVTLKWKVPEFLSSNPFSTPGAWFNLPAVLILAVVTTILVIGIRESAISNTVMVLVKLGVVVFVIAVGVWFVNPDNYTQIPAADRNLPQEIMMPTEAAAFAKNEAEIGRIAGDLVKHYAGQKDDVAAVAIQPKKGQILTIHPPQLEGEALKKWQEERAQELTKQSIAAFRVGLAKKSDDPDFLKRMEKKYNKDLPQTKDDQLIVLAILDKVNENAGGEVDSKWGMIALMNVNKRLAEVDDATRSNFLPYGISGMMLGAALVFFAFIGFDSISTHSEEAVRPQRDVPIGIIASLVLCTVLYICVAAVITGMVPYPNIDPKAAVSTAFKDAGRQAGDSPLLTVSAALIALGALAGMTSVLLITFLSQARIFLAMARDGLMPQSIFGAIHHRFRTPHVSTILTGILMAIVAAVTPIEDLEKMVNIGTLFAFTVVCAAVLILRIRRPDAPRPFRAPLVFVIAPLGIAVNLVLMLFLPVLTWQRLVVWLIVGLVIYFLFGRRHSALGQNMRKREGLPVE
jgi:amino acid transporter